MAAASWGLAPLVGQQLSLDGPSLPPLTFPAEPRPAGTANALLESDPDAPMPLVRPLPAVEAVEPLPPIESLPPVDGAKPIVESKAAAPMAARSEELERVARQADCQTRHGFELAGRGAYFAARAEFLSAIKLVAEGLDAQQKTDVHGRALAAAVTAMREAEDFLPRGSQLEGEPDIAGILASHTTAILKSEQGKITPMTALKQYMNFAQGQFAAAVEHELAGSFALHALGKLHVAMAKKKIGLIAAAEPKAMVFYQAAILAYPRNYLAANDLGVLLAQCGNYDEARAVLEHSLALSQQSTTWHNLALVYRQMKMTPQAAWADRQAAALAQAELARRKQIFGTASETVRWVDPQTFAQTSANTPNSFGTTPQPSAQAAGADRSPPPGTAAKSAARPNTAERMPWNSNGRW